MYPNIIEVTTNLSALNIYLEDTDYYGKSLDILSKGNFCFTFKVYERKELTPVILRVLILLSFDDENFLPIKNIFEKRVIKAILIVDTGVL